MLLLGIGLALSTYLTNKAEAEEANSKNDDEISENELSQPKLEGEIKNEDENDKEDENNEKEEKYTLENKFGLEKENLPERVKVKYLIIGGGPAAFAALSTLRRLDPLSFVMVVGGEGEFAYSRPALSKEVWQSDKFNTAQSLQYVDWLGDDSSLLIKDNIYYHHELSNVIFLRNTLALEIDATTKEVKVDNERESIIEYEKCLIATGSYPLVPDIPIDNFSLPFLSTFYSVEDFKEVYKIAMGEDKDKEYKKIAVIGSDFVACELADNLAQLGKKKGFEVHQIFEEDRVLNKVLPKYLSEYVERRMEEGGVRLHPLCPLSSISFNFQSYKLNLNLDEEIDRSGDRRFIDADYAIFAMGREADADFAFGELEIDPINGGIVANAELMARSDLFVAGDVVSFFDERFLKRMRITHFDHAIESAKHAARNLTSSSPLPYTYLPLFWTEFSGIEMQSVGICDANLKTVGVWIKPPTLDELDEEIYNKEFYKGFVYYLNEEMQIVGVLMCGMSDSLENNLFSARKLINKGVRHDNLLSIQRAIRVDEWDHLYPD